MKQPLGAQLTEEQTEAERRAVTLFQGASGLGRLLTPRKGIPTLSPLSSIAIDVIRLSGWIN